MVHRAATAKSTWMSPSVVEEMKDYRATEAFRKKSVQCAKNRSSKGKDGKAPGTHTMGRLNTVQFMDKMCEDNGGNKLPTPEELMKKSKTKRSGGYVCDEVPEVLVKLMKKKEALLETIVEDEIDNDEVYFETVEGFKKNKQVWGMGKATEYYFEKPLPSSGASKSASYTPGIASKLSKENQAIKEKLNEIEQWKLQLEQTLASKGIRVTVESCNPDSRDDDDGDVNEGNFATP